MTQRRKQAKPGTVGGGTPKVWCAEILCEHNKNNQCKANEINLSAGNIHTVNEGCRQIWTCRAFAMRDDAKKLKVFIEEFYKSRRYGDGMDKREG